MQSLIDVFRMSEVSPETRIRILIQLGKAVNDQFGSNVTEGIVYELVKTLNPEHELLKDSWYQYQAGVITKEQYREAIKTN
jgi:hypothetical protein